VPKLNRSFSSDLSKQMLQPMAKAAGESGQQSSKLFGQRLLRGLDSPLKQAGGLVAGAFAAKKVLDFFTTSIAQARESNQVSRQTEAAIRSTGGAAKVTTKQVSDLATAISNKTGKDDEAIQAGANMILTFKGIRNEAGKGNDIFNQTVQVTEDMTAAMNGGVITQENMRKTSIAVGKAMNDPIAGLTALRRVGVTFTEQQQEQIKTLVKSGHTLEAQKIILAELRGEFGGSAEASATAADKLRVRWGNFQEAVGNKLIPIIDRAAGVLIRFSDATQGIGPTVVVVGAGVAALGLAVLGTVTKVLAARDAWIAYRLSKVAQVATDVEVGTAEAALAGETAAAGNAAAVAGAKWTVLAGRLGAFGAAAAAGAYSGSHFDDQLKKIHESSNPLAKAIDWLNQKTTIHIGKNKDAANATSEQTAATRAQVPALQQAAAATQANAERAKVLSTKLTELRGQFHQTADSVKQSIQSYQGLVSQSKVTAREVIKDLGNQVSNFRTYSRDVKFLIKHAVSQEAIQELSQKGPQYVHALASGSNTELQRYKKFWADRQAEVKGGFARAMDEQYQKLAATIRRMNRELQELRHPEILVSARLKLGFTKSYTQADWARDRATAGRMAEGGLVRGPGGPTADLVPALLSSGEFVVNAKAVREIGVENMKRLNALRFAAGGPIGRIGAQTGAVNKIEAHGTGTRFYAALAAFMQAAGGFGAGPMGPASGDVVRLALAQAKRMAASFKVALALIEAGIVESGLRNLPYGDRDSLGFLQQRPSQGWRHPMNITYAAWDFLRRAIPIQGRYGTAGRLAQAVQRSAFPARYDAVQARALGILNAYGFDQGGWLPPRSATLAINRTSQWEPVGPPGAAGGIIHIENVNLNGPILGGARDIARDLAPALDVELRKRGWQVSRNAGGR